MTAWATVVAEKLGFTRQEALSIGQTGMLLGGMEREHCRVLRDAFVCRRCQPIRIPT